MASTTVAISADVDASSKSRLYASSTSLSLSNKLRYVTCWGRKKPTANMAKQNAATPDTGPTISRCSRMRSILRTGPIACEASTFNQHAQFCRAGSRIAAVGEFNISMSVTSAGDRRVNSHLRNCKPGRAVVWVARDSPVTFAAMLQASVERLDCASGIACRLARILLTIDPNAPATSSNLSYSSYVEDLVRVDFLNPVGTVVPPCSHRVFLTTTDLALGQIFRNHSLNRSRKDTSSSTQDGPHHDCGSHSPSFSSFMKMDKNIGAGQLHDASLPNRCDRITCL